MTVNATFDGEERTFHIKRQNVPFLEASFGKGLYAVLQDFVAGRWRFDDVAAVVSFGLHGPRPDDRIYLQMVADFGSSMLGRYKPHPHVVTVLQRDGHGNYADLAAEILTDVVFGEIEQGAPVTEPEDADAEE